jgi:hypothetical protein
MSVSTSNDRALDPVGSRPAPVYVVASPRPRVGRTLLARLLMEYAVDNGRPLVGFDLSPREPMLAGRFPRLVWPVDIAETRGQMELFDRLLADTASIKVVDLGYGAFEPFFDIAGDIGFAQEAHRRGMNTVIFFVADQAMATVRAYAKLQARVPAIFQPVHNESVCLTISAEDFPPTRPDCGSIRMPRLSQLVRGVIDRPGFSFNSSMARQQNGPTEIHSWTADLYKQFRDFELRLLFGGLNASLGIAPPMPARTRSLSR